MMYDRAAKSDGEETRRAITRGDASLSVCVCVCVCVSLWEGWFGRSSNTLLVSLMANQLSYSSFIISSLSLFLVSLSLSATKLNKSPGTNLSNLYHLLLDVLPF